MRKSPPISRAMALTSPTEPPMNPRNISILEGSSPAPSFNMPRGVAVDVASTAILGAGHVVISVAKDKSSTILPTIAGFATFFPMPPKSCLTMTIATKHPTTAIQNGSPEGTLNAIRVPVTAALRSPTVCLLFISLFHAHSKNTEATIQISVRGTTLNPNT